MSWSSYMCLLLEIYHDHSHPQTQITNQFSCLVLIHFSHLLHLQTFLASGSQPLSCYQKSDNHHSSCQVGVHLGSQLLTKFIFYLSLSWEGFQTEKIPDQTVLIWLHNTDLFNAFNSIWYSALLHQLIALDFPLSFFIYICSFLSDRWAKILFLCCW